MLSGKTLLLDTNYSKNDKILCFLKINMVEQASLEFRLNLNHVEYLLILALAVTGCVSISAFASLVAIPVGIISSAVGKKICAIIARIKKYKPIIKKKTKKHDNIVLLGKDKLNAIEILIFNSLINSYVSHEKFVFVNG